MLEKIRRIMEGPGLPKVVDSALREVKLSLAVDLFCQANAIDTARYRQREKGDTLGIDELTPEFCTTAAIFECG